MTKRIFRFLASSVIVLSLNIPQNVLSAQFGVNGNSAILSEQAIDLSLREAVALSLRGNPSLKSAYIQRVAQKFDLRFEEDRFTPKFLITGRALKNHDTNASNKSFDVGGTASLQGEYGTRIDISSSNSIVGRYQNNVGTVATITQPLLKGAGYDIATAPRQIARLVEESNKLSLRADVADTVTDAVLLFRNLLRSQEQLLLSRNALFRARGMLAANEELISAGRMAAIEIIQSQADIANIELTVEEAGNQLEGSRLDLLRHLGLALDLQIVAVEIEAPLQSHVEYRDLVGQAEIKQPRYLQQLISFEQAKIVLKVAQNDRLWDVSLVGGTATYRDRFSGNTASSKSQFAGIQVSIPLNDLAAQRAEVRAQANLEVQQLAVEQSARTLKRDVSNAVRELGTRWRQYEIAKRFRDLSIRKLEAEKEKLQAGRSSNFQVLSFEADLRTSENSLLNTMFAYLNAQTNLDRTIGIVLDRWEIELND